MKIAYVDCFSGASGNMFLGALLDAGLEAARLEAELAKLQMGGYSMEIQPVRRHGMHATYVEISVTEEQPHRHLADIKEIILNSSLPEAVQMQSLAVFTRLAEAEARVHGTTVDKIHFHEVGAVDAVVDIVGTAAGLWLLEVEQVYASAVHVGRGTVHCAHGTLPVPAPATLELLRGVPIYGRDVDAELVTPTGAAILTGLSAEFGAAPPMVVEQVGYGAGKHDLPWPNLLRVSISTTEAQAGSRPRAAGAPHTPPS